MPKYQAIAATTHQLENGFRHTKEDLEHLAEGFRAKLRLDPFLNENHLEGIAPLGRVLSAQVDRFLKDGVASPTEYALYLEFESLAGVDPNRIARLIEEGGFSVAFFGEGIGRRPEGEPVLSLTVGISAALLPLMAPATDLLDELGASLPDASVEVRRYHEHGFITPTTIALLVGWVGGKVADKLFDKLWTVLESEALAIWRKRATRLKLGVETENGRIHSVLPPTGAPEQYRRVFTTIVDEVRLLECGARVRTSIIVSEEWAIRVHREPLPLDEESS